MTLLALGKGAIVCHAVGNGRRAAVLEGVLERTRGLVTGVTWLRVLSSLEIAERFNVRYLPDHQLGPCFSRPVEACLSQGRASDGCGGL